VSWKEKKNIKVIIENKIEMKGISKQMSQLQSMKSQKSQSCFCRQVDHPIYEAFPEGEFS
jgi:hypothetical protein